MKKLKITLLFFLMFSGTFAQTIHRDTSYTYDYQVIDREVWCTETRIIDVHVQTIEFDDTLATEKKEMEATGKWKVSILPLNADDVYIYNHQLAKQFPGKKTYAHSNESYGNFAPRADIKLVYGHFLIQREVFEIRPYVIYHKESNSFDYHNDIRLEKKGSFSYIIVVFISLLLISFFYLFDKFDKKGYHKRSPEHLLWLAMLLNSLSALGVRCVVALVDSAEYVDYPPFYEIIILWIGGFIFLFLPIYLVYMKSFKLFVREF